MARPTVMTEEVVSKLEELLILGSSVEQACALAGIGRGTYYRYIKNGKGIEARHKMLMNQPKIAAKIEIHKYGNVTDFTKKRLELTRSSASSPCRVYVIAGGALFKVGMTTNSVHSRMLTMQSSSPALLSIAYARNGTRNAELRAHEILKEYRSHGEWFSCSEEMCRAAVNQAVTEWPAGKVRVDEGAKSASG